MLLLAADAASAQVVPNRLGAGADRASRIPRAADPPYLRRAPVRKAPRLKQAPPAEPGPIPRYGRPKPAIERIPKT